MPAPPVPDRQRQPLGGRLELAGLLRGQHRRRGLLDHLLVAPLHRAVPHAQRPRRALAVGDHLHLDVPRAGQQALQEHHTAAERALGLHPGALVGLGELLRGHDHPDAPAPAARGGLEHQRVADLTGHPDGGVQVAHRAAAPRRDRDADLLGDQLGADLVAELAHRLGGRADERHPEPLAQFGERRVLGDESPADPGRVRAALPQRPLQYRQVQVRPGAPPGRGGSSGRRPGRRWPRGQRRCRALRSRSASRSPPRAPGRRGSAASRPPRG